VSDVRPSAKPSPWDTLARADVLSGLLFIAVAALGLWISRDYAVGTALRMGTGYVPRLLCWMVQGLRAKAPPVRPTAIGLRATLAVTLAIVAFALSIERLGLVLAIVLLTGIGALATKALRPLETAIAALVLIALTWGIFIAGLGLTIPVWPDW
jgi:hypothetical protein